MKLYKNETKTMKGKYIDLAVPKNDLLYYDYPEYNPYFGYVAGGFFLFTCVNFATRALTPATLW